MFYICNKQDTISKVQSFFKLITFFLFLTLTQSAQLMAKETFTAEDVMKMKAVVSVDISPNGDWVAYTVSVPRANTDEPGSAYDELYLVSTSTGEVVPFITGKVDVTSPQWHPSGKSVSFLMKRNTSTTQVWHIPVGGGEAMQLTNSPTSIISYKWHPSGNSLAYIATEAPTAREKTLKKTGYDFVYFEEEWKHRHIYVQPIGDVMSKPKQLTNDITAWTFEFSADGNTIIASMSEKNLIDYRYAFNDLYTVDFATGETKILIDIPGKLGNYTFSPDGKHLAYAAALSQKDHAVSQAFVYNLASKTTKNYTPDKFRGHVAWVGWKNNSTLLYRAGEGVEQTLSEINLNTKSNDARFIILSSKNDGIVFGDPQISIGKTIRIAATGETPYSFKNVYFSTIDSKKRKAATWKKLTTLNPWLADRKLGKQEAVRFNARDGLEVEGLLIYPVDYVEGKSYPLSVQVHGGPESHYSNGWLTRYSNPGQVLANLGYVVYYPNYRASTGYGVEFAAWGYGNAAGPEFDDIADGIDHLISIGIADKDRVGLGGGSYGGFASAWFATYYTEKVRAVCMFVGISNLISKRGTTDIGYEELFVHSGKKLEEMWQQSLERSPIYHAHKSKTAVLISGGLADTRVHPSQSMELFRRLKMNDHPAVRMVQYPGEPHGNRKQTAQLDYMHRIIDWLNWYVRDLKPLDGEMPPLDISDKYGISLPE